jgi:hypothetical protein
MDLGKELNKTNQPLQKKVPTLGPSTLMVPYGWSVDCTDTAVTSASRRKIVKCFCSIRVKMQSRCSVAL